jgi:hypothetical protein
LIDSHIAQTQFACLLLLIETLNIQKDVKLYDPIMKLNHSAKVLNQFSEFLQSLYRGRLIWLEHNEECRHKIDCQTLFYMPHCSLQMYVNVLRANVNNLHNVIIMGNSFQSYIDRHNHEALRVLLPYMKEQNFDNDLRIDQKNFKNNLYECFNDISIHAFIIPKDEIMGNISTVILESSDESSYTSELITNELMSQLIGK